MSDHNIYGRTHDSQRTHSRLAEERRCSQPRRRKMFLEQLENRSLLAVMVWDGSANNLWSNAANWVGDVAPMAAVFGTAFGATVALLRGPPFKVLSHAQALFPPDSFLFCHMERFD